MARTLASIQRISEIVPIEGADRIELAKVLGWQVVVKKGQFKPNDLCVYIEIDSIVPDKPCFEFMRDRKFHVKTIKLRGVLSQGLIMPLADVGLTGTYKEGENVTNILGIKKYEPPEVAEKVTHKKSWFEKAFPFLYKKKVSREFPKHLVPQTDEPRLQSLGNEFLETYKDVPIYITIKMDGTSGTFIWYKKKFSVASRNVWMQKENDSVYWRVAKEANLEKAMKKLFKNRNVAIQGEICGSKIQGNHYKFDSLKLFIFGCYDIDTQEYYTPYDLETVADLLCFFGAKVNYVPRLPIKGVKYIKDIGLNVDDWLKLAERKSVFNPDSYDEGIVVRSVDNKPYDVKGLNGKRFSFKVVSNAYLMQYGL